MIESLGRFLELIDIFTINDGLFKCVECRRRIFGNRKENYGVKRDQLDCERRANCNVKN